MHSTTAVSNRSARRRTVLLVAVIASALVAVDAVVPSPASAATVTVTANMATPVDYPLVKNKFGLYNSCLVPESRYNRDLNLINELNTDSLRIDGGLGGDPNCGYINDPVGGSASALTYDWSEVDPWVDNLNSRSVTPYFSYGYQPAPLQVGGDWRSKPSSLPAWKGMLDTFANHFDQTDRPVGYHEIWNEPDFGTTFFTGTQSDYFNMYREGVRGIRQGDPDAVVGGLSSAYRTDWITPFLDYVDTNDLPLDLLSFHQYPGNASDEPAAIVSYLNEFKTRLAGRSRFHTTELHLNEYNSYPINYPQGGTQDKFGLASSLLRDYKAVLAQPSLDKVSWAQFMDSGLGNFSGMVTIDGQRKAVYNAAKIYGEMPADRRSLSITGASGVEGLASTDAHRSGVVLWNRSGASHTINLAFSGVPFQTGTLRVFRIDSNNASFGDNNATEDLSPTEVYANVATSGRTWSGTIPNGAVVYLRFDDASGIDSNQVVANGDIVRTHSYRPDRSKASYADFDPKTWTAYLGMATETWADEEVGVTIDGTPNRLNIQTRIDGTLQQLDANSCACFRIDYQVGNSYTKGVLFHGPYNGSADLYNAARTAPTPWGTGAAPNQVVAVPNLASVAIDVAAYAPTGWTGRTHLSFLLQNAGVGTRMTSNVINSAVGIWGFDESAGVTAIDTSGSGNAGTITSGTRSAGVTGSSLVLNGTTTSVNAGSSGSLNFGSGSFTASTWFKTTGTSFQRLLSKGNYGNTNGYLLATHNGALTFAVGANGVQANSVAINTPSGLNDNRWHHVAVAVDGATDTIRIYVDGVQQALTLGVGYCGSVSGAVASTVGCGSASASSTDALRIGSYNGTAEFFAGAIDDVRLYQGAMSAAGVRALSGLGSNPVSRWTFDDGSGEWAADALERRNHGHVSGGSWVTGTVGGALSLNGSSSTVDVGNVSPANFAKGSFSVATWFKTTGTAFQRLVSKGNYGNTDGYLLATHNGALTFAIGAGGNQSQSVGLNTPAGLNDGNWHHVLVAVDRASNTLKVYVDGVAKTLTIGSGFCGTSSGTTANLSACLAVTATSNGRLTIGSYNNTSERFTGSIDDLRLYSRAVAASDLPGIIAGR